MFNVRKLKDTDYSTLCQWWKDWRWTPPPKDFLPENGTGGLMIYKRDIEICAGFIYFTNSLICWNEFIVSNFHYKEKDRKDALRALIVELNRIAKNKGCRYAYTVVKNQNLENIYKELGFSKGSQKVNELLKVL